MAKLKTQKNNKSVKAFIDSIEDEAKRKDCRILLKMIGKTIGMKPSMWGETIVGFGSYRYKYKSGWDGEWFLTGLSPRKQNLVIYIMPGFSNCESLMQILGKYKTGKSCLYLKRLDDVDLEVLEKLIVQSVAHMTDMYECS